MSATPGERREQRSSKRCNTARWGLTAMRGFRIPSSARARRNLTLSGFFYASDNESERSGAPFNDDRLRGFRARADGDFADAFRASIKSTLLSARASKGLAAPTTAIRWPRAPGGRVNFTKIEGYASHTQPLAANFSAYAAAYGQYAFTPLLVPEQCGFGGRYFGRAFDPSQILGDSCIEATGELRYDVPGDCRRWSRKCSSTASPITASSTRCDAAVGTPCSSECGFRGRRGAARLVQSVTPICRSPRRSKVRATIGVSSSSSRRDIRSGAGCQPLAHVVARYLGPRAARARVGICGTQWRNGGRRLRHRAGARARRPSVTSSNRARTQSSIGIRSISAPARRRKIVMPSANSVELDRVTGGLGPSQIFGSLSSNGHVFLVNPDGILFGTGAQDERRRLPGDHARHRQQRFHGGPL